MTSYQRSIINMGLSGTFSEINSYFSRKSQNFPTPVYFAPPLMGFPLELGIGARGQKTRMIGLPDGQKSFKTALRLDTLIPACDRQTDGRTDGHRTTA